MLEKFITESPQDPFPRYGLAMELKNAGRLEDAAKVFATLLDRFPDYVPAFLHAGNVARELGDRERAEEIYRAGIAAAARKTDPHAKGELEAALMDLGVVT